MDKREANAIIYMLSLIIGILLILIFLFLLEWKKLDGRIKHSTREHDKAALVLREQREKMQKLLKTLEESNGREP
jgi:uncharacterized membrane protein